jgi:2-dehydro-3-deoxyphosphogluconate aldolase/(4S)-4-hydroxy-2-oxoglutarate aldolase
MKTPYLGKNGHIAIQTNYIDRAIYHLEMQGFEFDMDTAKYDANNKMVAIYFKGEIGDFAIHLLQKK